MKESTWVLSNLIFQALPLLADETVFRPAAVPLVSVEPILARGARRIGWQIARQRTGRA